MALAQAQYEAMMSLCREIVRRLDSDPASYTTRELITHTRQLMRGYKRTDQRMTKTSATLRFAVLERDAFTCRYCGRSPLHEGVVIHVDHVVPVAKGGESTLDNLITACTDCNRGKFDTPLSAPAQSAINDYVRPRSETI